MFDMDQYWIVVLCMGVGTFLFRFSFILVMEKLTLPEAFYRMLRFIPASVLPALVVPSVVLHKNGVTGFTGWDRLLAVLVAVLVAWKTRNVLATIGSGMLSLWILQALM